MNEYKTEYVKFPKELKGIKIWKCKEKKFIFINIESVSKENLKNKYWMSEVLKQT